MSSIDTNWKDSLLGDVVDIVIGGTPSRARPEYWDSDKKTNNKWVSIKDLRSKDVLNTNEYITDLGVEKSNVKLIQPNTVLMSFKLTIGKLSIARVPLYTNEAICAFNNKEDKVKNTFLYYGLQVWDLLENVDQAVKGITLNKEKLKKIKIKYPALKKQDDIVEKISHLDNSIELFKLKMNKLKNAKSALLQQLLTSGFESNEFIEHEYGAFPVSWSWRKISDVVELVERPADLEDEVLYKLVKAKRDRGGIVERDNLLGKEILVKNQFYIQEGDFLISKRQIVHGGCGIVPKHLEGAVVSNEYNVLVGSKEMDIEFFSYFANHPLMKHLYFSCSQGVIIEKFLFKTNE